MAALLVALVAALLTPALWWERHESSGTRPADPGQAAFRESPTPASASVPAAPLRQKCRSHEQPLSGGSRNGIARFGVVCTLRHPNGDTVLTYRHRVADGNAMRAYFLGSEHMDVHGCLTPADFVLEVDKTIICRRSGAAMVVQWLDFKRGWYNEVRGSHGYSDVLATLAVLDRDIALSAGKDRVVPHLRGCRDPDTSAGHGIQITWHCVGPGTGTEVTYSMTDSAAIARRHARDLLPPRRPKVKNECERPVSGTAVGQTSWTPDSDDNVGGPFWCFLEGESPVFVWVDDDDGVAYIARQHGSASVARRWSALDDSWGQMVSDE